MKDQIEAGEKQQPETERSGRNRVGIFFSTIAILIFVFGFGYGYFQLEKINVSLANMVTDLQNRLASNQNDITVLQKSVSDMQQTLQKSQNLSSQQEQLMSEWRAAQKGDLDKWHVAEAQYLVKLANDHLEFSHNIKMALNMLQQADLILQNIQDNNINDIRKSIANDVANLQATPAIDITSLYLQLSALNNQIDSLPLQGSPLVAENKQITSTPIPADFPWWKAGLEHSWQALQQIVIVRNNGSNSLPLVLPDEKTFFYQNLHAQMEGIMWALVHRNEDIYQANLARTIAWIKQYSVSDAALTKSLLQNLAELQKINIQPPAVNLSATLKLFDNYFAQTHEQTNNPTATPQ